MHDSLLGFDNEDESAHHPAATSQQLVAVWRRRALVAGAIGALCIVLILLIVTGAVETSDDDSSSSSSSSSRNALGLVACKAKMLASIQSADAHAVGRLPCVNERLANGLTPLMQAAALGDVHVVQRLLEAGADPFRVDNSVGDNALGKAAMGGHVDVARLLIDRGININQASAQLGFTPLHLAVWYLQPDMVEFLLDEGALIYPKSRTGVTAEAFIEGAWPKGSTGSATTEMIVSRMQDAFDFAQSALDQKAAGQSLIKAVTEKDLAAVKAALAAGADVEEKEVIDHGNPNSGYSPILLATKLNASDIFTELIKAGANPGSTDFWMQSNIGHKASAFQLPVMAQLAVEQRNNGFDLNALGRYNGYSPLHDGVWHGNALVPKVYVDNGCDVSLQSHAGRTPRDIAEQFGYIDIVEYIDQHAQAKTKDATRAPALLVEAVQQGDVAAVADFLMAGSDPDERDSSFGMTALMHAAARGSEVICDMLLRAGADVHVIDSSSMGTSLMHKAVMSGNPRIIRMLASKGAFVDMQAPRNGHSPLFDAVWMKHTQSVKALLDVGADVFITSHIASMRAINWLEATPRSDVDRNVKHFMKDMLEARQNELASYYDDTTMLISQLVHWDDDNPPSNASLQATIENNNEREILNDLTPNDGTANSGLTPLLMACRDNRPELVSALLAVKTGSSPPDIRKTGYQMKAMCGHKAGYMGHPDVMRRLVEHPLFEIDSIGPENGFTVLHDSVWHNNAENVRILLAAGVRTDIKSHIGETPKKLAERLGYDEIVGLL